MPSTSQSKTKSTLRHRLIYQLGGPFLLLLLFVFGTLLVSTFITFQNEWKQAVRVPENNALRAQSEISLFFTHLEQTLNVASESVGDIRALSNDTQTFLQRSVDNNIALLSLTMFDIDGVEQGRITETTLQSSPLTDQALVREYIDTVQLARTNVLLQPELSVYNTPTALWLFPIQNAANKLEGVLIAEVDVSSLWGIVSEFRQTTAGEIYIIDNDGRLLVSKDLQEVANARLVTHIEGVQNYFGSDKQIKAYEGLSGVLVLGTWESLEPIPWAIISEVPLSILLQQAQYNLIVLFLLALVTALLFIYELFVFRKVLLRPIDAFVQTIKAFSKGDLSARVKVQAHNELEDLASTFNNMASDLRESYQHLEEKVEEKTAELSKTLTLVSRQKQALKRANAEDVAMLESIADGLVVIDPDHIITLVNKAARQMLGWTENEMLGRIWEELALPSRENGEPAALESLPVSQIFVTQRPVSISALDSDLYYQKKDQSRVPVGITAAPIILNDELIAGIIVFRDISKEKEIDQAKTEFISFVAHQLKTPMTGIKWYTELLKDGTYGKLNDKQTGAVDIIEDSNERLVDLVKSLLNVSRIEMGSMQVDVEDVNVEEIIDQIIQEQAPLITQHNITCEKDIAESVATIPADPRLLRILLQNYISNAIKYSRPDGTVKIAIAPEYSMVKIAVTDQGHGIPKEEQPKIFTKMFRASNIIKHAEGSGLGLYMVKSILAYIGGKVWFESKEGEGSTFFATYPLEIDSAITEKKTGKVAEI